MKMDKKNIDTNEIVPICLLFQRNVRCFFCYSIRLMEDTMRQQLEHLEQATAALSPMHAKCASPRSVLRPNVDIR